MTLVWSALWLLMAQHLMVLSHQQAQCRWLKWDILFESSSNITDFKWYFCDQKSALKKTDKILCATVTLLELTHLPLVLHICIGELGQHWFRWWLVVYWVPSHYLNQCYDIVNWTIRNKLQWKLNQNSSIFIQENAFQNVCESGGHFVQGEMC